MMNMDEMKASLEKKLEEQRGTHAARLERDLGELRQYQPVALPDAPRRAARLAAAWSVPPSAAPLHGLLELSGSGALRELDAAFLRLFNLESYFPASRLAYPTIYCESLEEFYAPQVEPLNLSPQARRAALETLVAEAGQTARALGGGVLGCNLPGKAAYLNGWLFGFQAGVPAGQVFEHPQLARRVVETAIHEKLGHGFLFVYSALGQVKIRLGLGMVEAARRFGLREVDDPSSSLRQAQAGLVFQVSQLLEEGWATWLEMYLGAALAGEAPRPRYSLAQVLEVIQALPAVEGREAIQQAMLTALVLLFGEEPTSPEDLRSAVTYFDFNSAGLDEFFGRRLGQPLRYVIGELLFSQAESNLGAQCLPYAALIAANVTFDPSGLGLNDLSGVLVSDARLNPDARFAALSRIRLGEKNNIQHLARQAAAELSISIPAELK